MRMEWERNISQKRIIINELEIAEVISMMTGIPVQRIRETESAKLKTMSSSLQDSVI